MRDRKPDMDWLTFRDGTTGARYGAEDVSQVAAGSWDMATTPTDETITWSVDSVDDLDSDDLGQVSVDVGTLAELLRLARIGAQYAGCSVCRRVTVT